MGIPTDPMSFNRYLYCNADPINKDDPTGLVGQGRKPGGFPSPPSAGGSPASQGRANDGNGRICAGWVPCGPCPGHGTFGGSSPIYIEPFVLIQGVLLVDGCGHWHLNLGVGAGFPGLYPSGYVAGGPGCVGHGWGFGGGFNWLGQHGGYGPGGLESGVGWPPGVSGGFGYTFDL